VEVLGSLLCPDGHLPQGRLGSISDMGTTRPRGLRLVDAASSLLTIHSNERKRMRQMSTER
jgi:hypothetical protein